MSVYMYFALGIILGISITVVFFIDKSEKMESKIELERKLFCTKKLDNMIEMAANRIASKIQENKNDITEDEKDAIIAQCCKEKFEL